MAPPRHRRKRRPTRIVTAVPAPEPEPEPPPPPVRRGLLSGLSGPRQVRRVAARPVSGLPGQTWTRRDYYTLSGVTAVVIVVVGLVLGLGSSVTTKVASNNATNLSFSVTKNTGAGLIPGESVTVGSQQGSIASVQCDQVTLTNSLGSVPSSGTTVSQTLLFPFTPTPVFAVAVAASPAPTATTFDVVCDSVDFGANQGVTIDGQSATIKSVSGNKITLNSALGSAPTPGTNVTFAVGTQSGGLLVGIFSLTIYSIALFGLAAAAMMAAPVAGRLRHKKRPPMLQVLAFGALIAVVNTVLLVVTMNAGPLGLLVASASGFVVVPLVYPAIASMLSRGRPRQAAGSRPR